MTSQVSVSEPPASVMPTSQGVPLLQSPCSIPNEVSPFLLSTVNSIDASFSVPTVARQPLLCTSACVGFGLFEIDRQVLDVLDLGTVDRQDGIETEFDFC